jgi:hypothetical protein
VEAIAGYVIESALDDGLDPELRPARRCSVVRMAAVSVRTTLMVARYRFHLELPSRTGLRQLIAEDAATFAFEGSPAQAKWLGKERVAELLAAVPSGNVPAPQAKQFMSRAVDGIDTLRPYLEDQGTEMAQELLASHRRVRQASAEIVRGLKVTPEPGADVLGVFVFVPDSGAGSAQ